MGKAILEDFALEKISNGVQTSQAPAVDCIPTSGHSQPTITDEELIKKAMCFAISANNISISILQRKLGIGFPKAGKLIDTLVERGYISEPIDNKTRKIFMTKEQFEETFGEPVADYIPVSVHSQPAKTDDELVKKAMRLAICANNISISILQRKLSIGFPTAVKIIDSLVERGYISEPIDSKTRKIFMTKEQFEETFGEPL